MLRAEKAAGTSLGIEAERLTANGQLLPDETILSLVERWLSANDGAFNFDGFPRTLGQATALESLLAKRGTPLDAAILLEANLETIQGRVTRRMVCSQCGQILAVGLHIEHETSACPNCGGTLRRRSDDNMAALETRMKEYRDKTEPVATFYEERMLLHRADANRTPDEVFQSISAILS